MRREDAGAGLPAPQLSALSVIVFRAGINNPNIEFVGINDLGPVETNAHLLRYDSVHGRFPGTITTGEDWIDIGQVGEIVQVKSASQNGGQPLYDVVYSDFNPEALEWVFQKVAHEQWPHRADSVRGYLERHPEEQDLLAAPL